MALEHVMPATMPTWAGHSTDVEPPRVTELALDLGTAHTRLASRDAPLIAEVHSALPPVRDVQGALAVERGAAYPLAHGAVVDVEATAAMLAPHLAAGRGGSPLRPRVLVCHPSDATARERGRLVAAVMTAGAGTARLVPAPVAAVLGALGDDAAPGQPALVVDLGEGVTDIAVVRDRQVLASAALRMGLAELRARVRAAVLTAHDVELLPDEVGSLLAGATGSSDWLPVARSPHRHRRHHPNGRRLLRHVVFVRADVLVQALAPTLAAIARNASNLYRDLSPSEREAIAADGALVVGGGALLPSVSASIGQRLGLGLRSVTDPLHAVIAGARRLLAGTPDRDGRRGNLLSLSGADR